MASCVLTVLRVHMPNFSRVLIFLFILFDGYMDGCSGNTCSTFLVFGGSPASIKDMVVATYVVDPNSVLMGVQLVLALLTTTAEFARSMTCS